MLGVFDGEYAYKGPFHVQIDVTNDCNNQCIACWCNSPLLKDRRLSGSVKKQELPFPLVKKLLDELHRMGVEEIYYSGSGEPFMYPHMLDVLAYTKRHQLTCFVNTNFTLMNKEMLDTIMGEKIDWVAVSTWAATASTYVKTHPQKTHADFSRIKDDLCYLNSRKKIVPRVKLYNVIFNLNYFELEQMISFAHETGCDAVEFTVVDTIPGATDSLALNDRQIEELRVVCDRVKSQLTSEGVFRGTNVSVLQFDHFSRRLSVKNDAKAAWYDKNIIDTMPCYIGWLFSRIIPNGDVHACLKAHRIPVGNLHRDSFSKIWNAPLQRRFRKKTRVCKKNDPFFYDIGNDPGIQEAGCYKSCDDIGRNILMHSRITTLPRFQQCLFSAVMGAWRTARAGCGFLREE